MRIVVAPDKFKGTVGARDVARAIEAGIRTVRPDVDVSLCPVADGGEGTAETLFHLRGRAQRQVAVSDPLGRPVSANVVALEDGSTVIESAAASGLHLLQPHERDALRTSSRGTGELLLSALRDDLSPGARVIVGVGGTASTDGGTGAARAAGWSFLDSKGRPLDPGGAALRRLARIEAPEHEPRRPAVEVVGACDVDTPLIGARGCARVFGPQKGASLGDVEVLEEGLECLAGRMKEDLGFDVAGLPHAGAGGGLGAGLAAFFGAVLLSGFDLVSRQVGLERLIREADLVITGEGRLDEQSLMGKCTGRVAELCSRFGKSCWVLAAEVALDAESLESAGFRHALGLVDLYGRDASLARPLDLIADATALAVTDRGP